MSAHKMASELSASTQRPFADQHRRGQAVNYRRIAVFAGCILLALVAPGALLAMLLGGSPGVFGHGPEVIERNFHLFDHLFTGAAVVLAYFCFLHPLANRLVAHAIAAYLAVEAILYLGGLVLGDSLADGFIPSQLLIDAAYGAIGVALAYAWQGWRNQGRSSPGARA